jgi:plastocyanin
LHQERKMSERHVVGRVAGACVALSASFLGLTAPSIGAHAEKRFFTILAVEPKGGTTVDKEPYPASALPQGGGYVMSKPDEKTQRWEVSAYVWQPAQIIVIEGDEVTLEFVGINGAAHPTTIAAFGQTFTVKRGQAHRVTFSADKVGIHGITCNTHSPSMSGELIVMPKR